MGCLAAMRPPHDNPWLFWLELLVRFAATGLFLLLTVFSAFLADSGTRAAYFIATVVGYACLGVAVGCATRYLRLLGFGLVVFATYVVVAGLCTVAHVPEPEVAGPVLVVCMLAAIVLAGAYFFGPGLLRLLRRRRLPERGGSSNESSYDPLNDWEEPGAVVTMT